MWEKCNSEGCSALQKGYDLRKCGFWHCHSKGPSPPPIAAKLASLRKILYLFPLVLGSQQFYFNVTEYRAWIFCPRVGSKNESSEDALEERYHYMLEKIDHFLMLL